MESRELIVTAIEAANRGDMEVVAELVHEEFVGAVPPEMSAEPDSYVGPAGVRRYFELWHDTVDDLSLNFRDFAEVGEWTIAIGSISGSGRGSGLPVELNVALATQIREGKVFRMQAFPDLEAARSELEPGS